MKTNWKMQVLGGIAGILCAGNLTSWAQADIAGEVPAFEAFLSATVSGPAGTAASDPMVYSQVVVVADPDSNSLIVSAPEEVLRAIDELIRQLDQPVQDQSVLKSFFLQNADPTEMIATLEAMFPDPTAASTGSSSSSGAAFGPAPEFRSNATSRLASASSRADRGESGRAMKLTKLIAVADARTGALVVNAPARLMPVVESLIEEIDANTAQQSTVAVIRLKNATYELESILQGVFGSATTQSTSDQSNPLLNRSLFLNGGGAVALGGGSTAQ